MAHVELRIGIEHHLTLVHFELMDNDKARLVNEVLTEIMGRVKRAPTGTFGDLAMFGRFKNVHGRRVNSPYVDAIRVAIIQGLEARGVIYSDTFDWNPHVSKPLIEWHTGAPVPFADHMTFRWKGGHPVSLVHYELQG